MSAQSVEPGPRPYEQYLTDLDEVLAAVRAVPVGSLGEFLKRLIGAYNDLRRGDRDQIGLLLAGIVVEMRLATNPSFLTAVDASEEHERQLQGRPEAPDLEKVLVSLRTYKDSDNELWKAGLELDIATYGEPRFVSSALL
jgi:hypothetical protein